MIFLQLLEFKGRKDDALEVLKDYQKNNSSNPNAIRYLYEFYVRHEECDDIIINTLKVRVQFIYPIHLTMCIAYLFSYRLI